MGATKLINDNKKKNKAIARRPNNIKKKPKKKKNILVVPFELPDELIFCILVRLSADILFNTVRYVCKQWFNIIKDPLFIREHVVSAAAHDSRYVVGLSFHCPSEQVVYFAQFGPDKKPTLSKLMTIPFISEVLSVCDGLILFRCETTLKVYVANPTTKQLLMLPSHSHMHTSFYYRLTRAGSLMEYKVVFTGYRKVGVITLGKDDTWRHIDVPSFRDCPTLGCYDPLVVGKFIHWSGEIDDGMLTFDVESESFSGASVPKPNVIDSLITFFFERGGRVTFMAGFCGNRLWEVWSWPCGIDGECKKLLDIDFRPQKCQKRFIGKFFRKGQMHPVVWIDNDVVVFRDHLPPYSFVSHNIKTGNTCELTSCYNSGHSDDDPYVNYTSYASTLVSF